MATTPGCKRAWKLQEFVAHGASVNCLSIGRKSGRVMVTGGEDKKVNLWAVGKPNCIMSLTGHTTPVDSVRFRYSEDMVCAGSSAGALKVWDLEAARIVRTLTGHKGSVKSIEFHPYGEFVASASVDTNLKMWDIRRKGCIYTYKGHNSTVNSLKFSPDGRWIASGGEDGTVKLWDLAAGKLLTEFRGHTSSITDVEFHPNEFLLASGSTDRSVKFWDLESFRLVSSTDGDTGLVRCIYFNPNGECLFSGAQDHLKVYGWEPARTYDTLVMGWNKVSDIATSHKQLVAGAFSLTNVSVYVVDLKWVYPFGTPPNSTQARLISQQNTFSPGNHMRKSFTKGRPQGRVSEVVELKMNEPESTLPDDGVEDGSFADIKEAGDYNAIFHPGSEYFIRNKDPQVKIIRPENPPLPFIPPIDSSVTKNSLPPVSSASMQLNSTYTKLSEIKPAAYSVPVIPTAVPLSSQPTQPPMHLAKSSIRALDKSTTVTQHVTESTTISIVRPVPIQKEKKTEEPQKAVVLPEPHQKGVAEFIPEQRETPAGLDVLDFLPRHLQDSLRLGGSAIPQVTENEALAIISQGHPSMIRVLQHRHKNLQIILAQWGTKEPRVALESAITMNDLSLIVDIINMITLRPPLWTLDMCQLLLPSIYELLQSKYETYMTAGCSALRLILKNFASIIKSNITAPPGIGVDIPREERYNKCVSCYNQLLSVRAFLLKRQTLQGKLGQSFRELHILMQNLE